LAAALRVRAARAARRAKRMKRTTRLTIETERVLVIRGRGAARRAWCAACDEVVTLVISGYLVDAP
jgi:hypothetical protein